MMAWRWKAVPITAIAIGVAAVPLLSNDYASFQLDSIATFAIVAVGLSFFTGSTGQFSLGHAGFYAIGAFAAGILSTRFAWPWWLDVPAGGLTATLAAAALGIPTLRLSGPYMAIATLGFGLLAADVLSKADWAGGRTGISLSPALSNREFTWVILAVLVAGTILVLNVRRGGTGRAFAALRQSDSAARASCIAVARYRISAFALSAGYAGIGGALYAHWAGYISAESFGLPLSIFFLAAIVVGGVNSIWGGIVGATLLSILRLALQDQPHLADAIYGAVVVAILLFVPGGIMALLHGVRARGRVAGSTVPKARHG